MSTASTHFSRRFENHIRYFGPYIHTYIQTSTDGVTATHFSRRFEKRIPYFGTNIHIYVRHTFERKRCTWTHFSKLVWEAIRDLRMYEEKFQLSFCKAYSWFWQTHAHTHTFPTYNRAQSTSSWHISAAVSRSLFRICACMATRLEHTMSAQQHQSFLTCCILDMLHSWHAVFLTCCILLAAYHVTTQMHSCHAYTGTYIHKTYIQVWACILPSHWCVDDWNTYIHTFMDMHTHNINTDWSLHSSSYLCVVDRNTYIHTWTHTYIHTYIITHILTYTGPCIYTLTCTHTYIHTYIGRLQTWHAQ